MSNQSKKETPTASEAFRDAWGANPEDVVTVLGAMSRGGKSPVKKAAVPALPYDDLSKR